MTPGHAGLAPSDWVRRWSSLVPPGGRVLDVACGSGRHVRWFAARGAQVTALDRDAQALAPLRALTEPAVEVIEADIENAPWPLAGRRFDAVVVTNYLWRALLPTLVASVAEGGVLLYETFARGNETVGRPANPDFLLEPGELLRVVDGLRVIAFEDGFVADAPARFVQRIAAAREAQPVATPWRYPL
jgi:SAM-dependent methyltransferase